jgi:dynein heavy chain
LRDVNVPKFLAADLVLFENIILDLFPGVEKPQVDYGDLKTEIESATVGMKLEINPYFIHKVI